MTRFYLRYAGRKESLGEVYEIVDGKDEVIVGAPAPREDLLQRCKDLNGAAEKAEQEKRIDAWSAPISATPATSFWGRP